MNVIPSTAALSKRKAEGTASLPRKVNFYFDSPNIELSLDEFEVYAMKRLKVRNRGSCF
jgi:hypothetical protein